LGSICRAEKLAENEATLAGHSRSIKAADAFGFFDAYESDSSNTADTAKVFGGNFATSDVSLQLPDVYTVTCIARRWNKMLLRVISH